MIATIHHLACSGGTLITRSLATMQNVYMLSELNPIAPRGVYFNPMGPLQQATAKFQNDLQFNYQDFAIGFLNQIDPIYRKVQEKNGTLLIRDHSHTDWIIPQEERGESTTLEFLKLQYNVKPILTLRNPIEQYASLKQNGFQRSATTFDEFCRRMISFVNYFNEVPKFHYEDFVINPDEELRKICQHYNIPFLEDWRDRLNEIMITGASGRMGLNEPIKPLPVKSITYEYRKEILESENYKRLCEMFGYFYEPNDLIRSRYEILEG